MRKLGAISGALAVAGCTSTIPEPVAVPVPSQPMTNIAGLERVLGRNASELTRLFGDAVQDFREDGARKLQFSGEACVLDTYLYPERGGGELVVTYVDARNGAGENVSRAACVDALARR